MNRNSIPPGYQPNDELWTQNTEVFAAVGDDHEPAPARRKVSNTGKYAIIGLSATIVVALAAIGALLLSRGGGWDAMPNAATGPDTPHVVLTPPASNQVTVTGAPPSTHYTTVDPPTAASSTTSSTPTTTAAVLHAACTQPGQTAAAADGTMLTCDVAGDAGTFWMPVKPAVGLPCTAAESGTFGYSNTGAQLVCARRAGSAPPVYGWDSPGPITSGKHEPGQICNLKKDVIAQTSSGRAVYCLPADGSTSPYIGAWKPQS
ncbi:hypothetical protein D7D52_33485 [Nocardia yunnanensis]|uniref:Uncharacterized protein n=1 Tax=Nocardia yunnanensis TaxID=2382165 RepID=A0A386ZKT5_9NOCA|nr:hypothetical protein [Nocardia yunnanensis]AYF77920.1 hypothetical protein D7D52_33485 [Nocardia yunnanensis]